MATPQPNTHIPRPRRKACDQCADAKVRCDHKRPCTRCQQRGTGASCSYPSQTTYRLSPYDSRSDIQKQQDIHLRSPANQEPNSDTSLPTPRTDASLPEPDRHADIRQEIGSEYPGLVCHIDASKIQTRWLRTFIEEPGAKTKSMPPGVEVFISRILKSYASVLLNGSATPPFIHPSQRSKDGRCQILPNCFSLIRFFDDSLPSNATLRRELVEREMKKIYDEHATADDDSLFATFQAYLLYIMALLFHEDVPDMNVIRQAMIDLQQIACATTFRGITTMAEMHDQRPQWFEWCIAESKRRTLYTMYLLDNILCARDYSPVHLGVELRGLSAPASGILWRATDESQWKRAYNTHIARWQGQSLTIDELWAMSPEFSETDILLRRKRVDQWLEGADEFGTMIFAVTTGTHGA